MPGVSFYVVIILAPVLIRRLESGVSHKTFSTRSIEIAKEKALVRPRLLIAYTESFYIQTKKLA